jgi:hypothetical protein
MGNNKNNNIFENSGEKKGTEGLLQRQNSQPLSFNNLSKKEPTALFLSPKAGSGSGS